MRWILLILIGVALVAPVKGCERRSLLYFGNEIVVPPVAIGSPAARLGTDLDGRDTGCLLARGVRKSLQVALEILVFAFPIGVFLGLIIGWLQRRIYLYGELFILIGVILALGQKGYRVGLAVGMVVFVARVVSTRVEFLKREAFILSAVSLGGNLIHIIRRHIFPNLIPILPGMLAGVLGVSLTWMAELAAIGFYDAGGYWVQFGSGFEPVPEKRFLPLNPDLAQLVSTARLSWILAPEQLFLPAFLLVMLSVSFSDLARAFYRDSGKPVSRGAA